MEQFWLEMTRLWKFANNVFVVRIRHNVPKTTLKDQRIEARWRNAEENGGRDPCTIHRLLVNVSVEDGNSADGENSNGDETSVFHDFLHNDSVDD